MGSLLDNTEVEIRENRVKTAFQFLGTLQDFNKQIKEETISCKGCSYSQCTSCMQGSASVVVNFVRDAACVVHSPIGCASDSASESDRANIQSLERFGTPGRVNVLCTNISEKDTVYGGVEQLEAGIREAYRRFSPKAIFVQSSCAAGIVGDDLESTSNDLADELRIPVVPIYCEGFKAKTWSSGFDAVFHGVLRKIVKKTGKRDKNLVNVFCFCNADTFSPLLSKLGLKANVLLPLADVDTLAHMGEAACSTTICETLGTYVNAVLESDFGVRQVRSAPPYGITWTDEWLRAIARETGKEEIVEDVIRSEHERIAPELARLRKELKGTRVYIFSGDSYVHNMASLAHDLGLEIVGTTSLHHDLNPDNPEAADTVEQLIDLVGDIPNVSVCNMQPYQTYKLIEKAKPDVVIARHGGLPVIGGKLGIPILLEGDANQSVGYDGILSSGQRLLTVLKSKRLVETLKEYSELPYTKWWQEQEDPFYFKEGN